jgi:hypothetical protein
MENMQLIIKKFKDLYDKKRKLKSELEETQKSLDQWEIALLEKFNEEGVQNIKTDLGMFFQREDFFASYDHDREQETFAWLRDTGNESLIKQTVNSKTLAAWAKEAIDQGVELPEFFNVNTKKRIGVRTK